MYMLIMYICMCIYFVYCIVTITTPPEDTTVCRGSDVTISCGYDSNTLFDVVWTINGTTHLTQSDIMNMSSYQVNNPTIPVNYSLTILSINGTTEIRCTIASNIIAALSPIVTITLIGMCIMYINYVSYMPVLFKYFKGQNFWKNAVDFYQ